MRKKYDYFTTWEETCPKDEKNIGQLFGKQHEKHTEQGKGHSSPTRKGCKLPNKRKGAPRCRCKLDMNLPLMIGYSYAV
jgi:hypothetical protein